MVNPKAALILASPQLERYSPPAWLPEWLTPPQHRVRLGHLPTPVERWQLPEAPCEDLWIKRDDYSGSEMSGNKVRKLEFLLAEALARECDSVVTVGGIQSNHCRATAVAARRLGLEPHLVLRGADQGLVGNLLVSRLVGAELHIVDEEEFRARGGAALVDDVVEKLEADGKRPFAFLSGGSNALGTWGYLQAVDELKDLDVDRIYFACGSGGTAAGLALGLHLADVRAELVGLCVDDSPDFFFDKIDAMFAELTTAPPSSRDILRLESCLGAGYGVSTPAELQFIARTARASGVVLDPVYSGKAALGMLDDLRRHPARVVLFIHTGGHLGLYAKEEQLKSLLL